MRIKARHRHDRGNFGDFNWDNTMSYSDLKDPGVSMKESGMNAGGMHVIRAGVSTGLTPKSNCIFIELFADSRLTLDDLQNMMV